jgi:proteasome lid subunit RPN8/RPN11
MRDASSAARRWREVCGLLVDTGYFLRLVPVMNGTRREGGFLIRRRDLLRVERAARTTGVRVVRAYHSHVVSQARPGDGDPQGGYRDFMLILDAVDKTARLWRVRGKTCLLRQVRSHLEMVRA